MAAAAAVTNIPGESVSVADRVKIMCSVHAHGFGVKTIRSCGGSHVLTSSPDRTIKLWDLRKGKSVNVMKCSKSSALGKANIGCLEPLDNRNFVVGFTDGQMRLFDAKQGSFVKSYGGSGYRRSEISQIVVDPNRGEFNRICIGYGDGSMAIVDLVTGKNTNIEGHKDGITSLLVLSNQLISASFDGTIRAWSLQTGQALFGGKAIAKYGNKSRCVLEKIEDDVYACGGAGNPVVSLFQAHTGKLNGKYAAICTGITVIKRVSATVMAAGADDGIVQTWNLQAGKPMHILSGHHSEIKAIEVVKEDFILTAAYGGDARVWDVPKGTCVLSFTGFMDEFLYSSHMVHPGIWAAGYSDGYLHIWDMRDALNMDSQSLPKLHFTKSWKKIHSPMAPKRSSKALKQVPPRDSVSPAVDEVINEYSSVSDDDSENEVESTPKVPSFIRVHHLPGGRTETVDFPYCLKEQDFANRALTLVQQTLYTCVSRAARGGYTNDPETVPSLPNLLNYLADVGNTFGVSSWLYAECCSSGKKPEAISQELNFNLEELHKDYQSFQQALAKGDDVGTKLVTRVFRSTSLLILQINKQSSAHVRHIMDNMSVLYEIYKFQRRREGNTQGSHYSLPSQPNLLAHASFLHQKEGGTSATHMPDSLEHSGSHTVSRHKSFPKFTARPTFVRAFSRSRIDEFDEFGDVDGYEY